MSLSLPSKDSYPEQLSHIQSKMSDLGKTAPATMQGFGALHKAATAAGTLDGKTKELIALAIAVSARCDGCIAFHTHDALKAGANRQEITEALEVAVLMGGGPALMYATHVLDAIAQFESADAA
ncbi:MAG: carboxymuconolactone decarboxylase family protein [Burkholderiaceae bacterium]